MSEAEFTRKVCDGLRAFGCLIFVAAGNKFGSAGWPDRHVILPDGQMYWLEFKTADGRLSKLQHYQLERINQRANGKGLVVRMPNRVETWKGELLYTFASMQELFEGLKNV